MLNYGTNILKCYRTQKGVLSFFIDYEISCIVKELKLPIICFSFLSLFIVSNPWLNVSSLVIIGFYGHEFIREIFWESICGIFVSNIPGIICYFFFPQKYESYFMVRLKSLKILFYLFAFTVSIGLKTIFLDTTFYN